MSAINNPPPHAKISEHNIQDVITITLENGEQITLLDINTPLTIHNLPPIIFFTAHTRDIEVLNDLIILGANLSVRDSSGMSALHHAAMIGDQEIVEALLNADSSLVDLIDNNGTTALMYAAMNGHSNLVEQLLQYQPDIYIIDNLGNNALYYSTNHQNILTTLQNFLLNTIIQVKSEENLETIFNEAFERVESEGRPEALSVRMGGNMVADIVIFQYPEHDDFSVIIIEPNHATFSHSNALNNLASEEDSLTPDNVRVIHFPRPLDIESENILNPSYLLTLINCIPRLEGYSENQIMGNIFHIGCEETLLQTSSNETTTEDMTQLVTLEEPPVPNGVSSQLFSDYFDPTPTE
ncbi:MAG: ankyrin repeat domain-containing protein [Rickettsiales bacterium]|jgi:hypothetical protein|nr:ankyrin repeat domain-containing protein [Rickettsiales bacterium]